MSLMSIIFIAIGLSMDAFAVSIANGIAMKKLELKNMLRFGLYFGIAQGIMPIIGYYLAKNLFYGIMAYSHWVAFVLLFIIGAKMLYEAIHDNDEENVEYDVSNKKMVLLSIATSIDAMAVGVSFALMGANIWYSALIIGGLTFFISAMGVYIGNKIGAIMQKSSEIFGGSVLIIIGIKILVEHFI